MKMPTVLSQSQDEDIPVRCLKASSYENIQLNAISKNGAWYRQGRIGHGTDKAELGMDVYLENYRAICSCGVSDRCVIFSTNRRLSGNLQGIL